MNIKFEWSAFSVDEPYYEIVAVRHDELSRGYPPESGTQAARIICKEYFRDVYSVWFDEDGGVVIAHIVKPQEFAGFYEVSLQPEIAADAQKCEDPRKTP